MTTIVLVRHGQTAWNRLERFRGQADVPLDATGLAQAEATARAVAVRWRPAAIYSSPLSRAMRTAEAIAASFGLDVQPHPGLLDINYGQWQGLTPEEVGRRWPEELRLWYEEPWRARIPGGESLAEVQARGFAAIEEIAARHDGDCVVAVAHTVMNRLILLAAMGLGLERFWRLRQETCAMNVLKAERGEFTIALLNDTCHLRAT